MGVLKKYFKYEINLTCPNCGCPNKTQIPRGTKVVEFVKEGKCKCDNCGVVFYPKEYSTKWLN